MHQPKLTQLLAPAPPLSTTQPKLCDPFQPRISVIMPPNSKTKNNRQKLAVGEDRPDVGMIEKDGPLVDSPVPIDVEESQPGDSSQDVRALHSPRPSPH